MHTKRPLFRSLLLGLMLLLVAPAMAQAAGRFAIKGEHFLLDGKPYVIRAGEMHYPRVPREYWRDRFKKARALGLNTIQTYVFWNLHEPVPGKFDFSGNLDIAEFVRIAKEEGLNVIVRPGPYICTELDFGGFPGWLLRTPGLRVRSLDPRFMEASARYMKRVAEELAPLQDTRGGSIIMVQVENEYGSFGRDHDYMEAIKQQVIDAGFDVPLFTSDGPGPHYFEGGPLPGVTAVINFSGSVKDAEESFKALAEFRPNGPRMVGEFWAGWFDHWGEKHHTTSVEEESKTIDWFLDNDISFNLYMFHGGTSWGYLAGANYGGEYQPDTSAYDYDAPLDEAGRPTPKYHALRKVIAEHLAPGETLPEVPASAPTIAIPRFELNESVTLLDALPALSAKPIASKRPISMEEIGQNFGFVLYRKPQIGAAKGKLAISEARDRVTVLANGKTIGSLYRGLHERELDMALDKGTTLDLLVENMGRVNFGAKLVEERKGLFGTVSLGDNELTDWQIYSLPLDDLSGLEFKTKVSSGAPAFWRGQFELKQTGDTFLDTRGWGQGHVWVNGHHLGRYWKVGPQQTLFVPGVWLREGRNEVIVLDVEGGSAHSLQGVTNPVYETIADALKPKKAP